MSTTLHEHPPHPLAERQPELRTTRRPTALDKLALHLGLLLITYGRRRYALSREQLREQARNDQARHARESDWNRARHLLLPPR